MTAKRKEPWPSVYKAIRRGIRKLREKAREATLFVHVTKVGTTYRIPEAFKEEDFAGLELMMHLESTGSAGEPYLLAFWVTKDFFERKNSACNQSYR